MSKVRGRKESTGLINDNLKQNNRRGEIIAQHSNMLNILPHSPPSNHLTTTLLADVVVPRHFHCPHFSLYKLHIGATGFLLGS